MNARILLLLAVVVLNGCHTPFAPPAAQADYTVQQMGINSFLILYAGDGTASDERIIDFGMLRACHVAQENGYDYFALVDVASSTPDRTVFGKDPLREDLNSGLVIQGFSSRPKGIFFFKVASVESMIRKKYQPEHT